MQRSTYRNLVSNRYVPDMEFLYSLFWITIILFWITIIFIKKNEKFRLEFLS